MRLSRHKIAVKCKCDIVYMKNPLLDRRAVSSWRLAWCTNYIETIMPVHMIFALISCPGKPMVLVMPYARLRREVRDSHLEIFCI